MENWTTAWDGFSFCSQAVHIFAPLSCFSYIMLYTACIYMLQNPSERCYHEVVSELQALSRHVPPTTCQLTHQFTETSCLFSLEIFGVVDCQDLLKSHAETSPICDSRPPCPFGASPLSKAFQQGSWRQPLGQQ